jgi:AcrR family transcriptional regulator
MPRPGSREEILDAAERALVASGRAAIRQEKVAADAGVAGPTLIHHFHSRDQLIREVVDRATERVRQDRLERLATDVLDTYDMPALLARILESLAEPDRARLQNRLASEGLLQSDPTKALASAGAILHGRREAESGKRESEEDTLFALVLASLALGAEPVVGRETWDSAGLGADADVSARFRAWLFELLAERLGARGAAGNKAGEKKSVKRAGRRRAGGG